MSFGGGGFGAFANNNASGASAFGGGSSAATPGNSSDNAAGTPAPSGSIFGQSNVFGQGTSSTTASATPAKTGFGAFGGGTFGSSIPSSSQFGATPTANNTQSTTPTSTPNAFGAWGVPTVPAAESSTAPSDTPTKPPPMFGAPSAWGAPNTPAAEPSAAPSDTPTKPPLTFGASNTFGTFGQKNSTPAVATTTSAPSPFAPSNFGAFGVSKSPENLITTGASSSGTSLFPPNNLSVTPEAQKSIGSTTVTPAGFGSFGKPADPAPAPGAGGGLGSSTAVGADTPKPSASSPSSFGLFGAKKNELTEGAPSSSAPEPISKASPFSGLLKPSGDAGKEKEKDGVSAPTPAATLFGAFGTKTPNEKDKDGASAPAASLFNSFGAKKVEEPTKSTTGLSTTTVASAVASTATAPTATPSAGPPPSLLKGKTLDEILGKWNTELDSQTREFTRMAGEVAVWDRALMENSEKMNFLYNKVAAAIASQQTVEESLKHIEEQQAALNRTLDAYEETTKQILNTQGRQLDLGPANRERDNSYGLASNLNSQLDDLAGSLTSMIDIVNGLGGNSDLSSSGLESKNTFGDPIVQIEAILNAHLGSLQWIDGAVKELENKVRDVELQQDQLDGADSAVSSAYGGRGFGLGPVRH